MKYLDPGQYLLSPTPSNEEQEETSRYGFSRVMAALSRKSVASESERQLMSFFHRQSDDMSAQTGFSATVVGSGSSLGVCDAGLGGSGSGLGGSGSGSGSGSSSGAGAGSGSGSARPGLFASGALQQHLLHLQHHPNPANGSLSNSHQITAASGSRNSATFGAASGSNGSGLPFMGFPAATAVNRQLSSKTAHTLHSSIQNISLTSASEDPSDMDTDIEEALEIGFKHRKLDLPIPESGIAAKGDYQYSFEEQAEAEAEAEKFTSLLSLPLEILHHIIELVYYDNNPLSISSNLEMFSKTMPLLLKTINSLSLRFLYKYANFNRPHAFDKFLQNLLSNPEIGFYVEFMDFQQFTSIGLGRTGRMMQEIQMVTLDTIHTSLNLTPNLLEFLALENIQDDLDVGVLDCLFNGLPKLQAIDFCGASSERFSKAFQELIIYDPNNDSNATAEGMGISMPNSATSFSKLTNPKQKSPLSDLFKLSFHDCSNLHVEIFEKILPHLVNLRRLDLNHTSITSASLNQHLPKSARLTHLSLARCSKLTTKDLIQFLTQHPSVTNGLLNWLSLQTDSNVVSPLSDTYLLYTLRNLNAPNLRYLNLGGLPVDKRHLDVIKSKFPKLESLGILHSPTIDINELNDFLSKAITLNFIDITACKKISRFHIPQLLGKNFNSNLLAIEFDYKILMDLTGGEYIKANPLSQSYSDPVVQPQIWKFFDNEGRRSWIYKIESTDPFYKRIVSSSLTGYKRTTSILNLTYYDLETGKKITQKFKKPDFLKYASRKVCCSIGYHRLDDSKKKSYIDGLMEEDTWPSEFSQRGIYNYYSLNVK